MKQEAGKLERSHQIKQMIECILKALMKLPLCINIKVFQGLSPLLQFSGKSVPQKN